MIFKTNLSYDFRISKFNELKVTHHLYSQCWTQTLSKTTFFTKPEGVLFEKNICEQVLPPLQIIIRFEFSRCINSIIHLDIEYI
jgi:hypothetical protein